MVKVSEPRLRIPAYAELPYLLGDANRRAQGYFRTVNRSRDPTDDKCGEKPPGLFLLPPHL
jgi:hypothetical protein